MTYPRTFKPIEPSAESAHPAVFDPALKQFSRAFRQGEPRFLDPITESRWKATRNLLWYELLEDIAHSPWKDDLVLRGSFLMQHWYGDLAREPGDLDWVVRPPSRTIESGWAGQLFEGLTRLATQGLFSRTPGVVIDDVRTEDIWTYERVPGRRIVYYWRSEAVGAGCLQMDFVFGEHLWSPPVPLEIPSEFATSFQLWSVDKEQSLAWKLMWLDGDMHPQGKDLFDAALLAEDTVISPALLKLALADRIFRDGSRRLDHRFPLEWSFDWEAFRAEYPTIPGDGPAWQNRLRRALERSFRAATGEWNDEVR